MNTPGDAAGIVPLFATPFAAVETGTDHDFNTRLVRLCDSREVADNFFESADPTAGELGRLVLGRVTALVAGLSSRTMEKLNVRARSWCSIVSRDGHIPSQHFSNASWLAIYCAQAGESGPVHQGAGVLRLYERRLGSIYRDVGNQDLRPPYRYGNHTWTPAPGWMALFPAHVPHEVSVVRSDTPLVLVFALIRFPGE